MKLKKKILFTIKKIQMNEKGQADIIGNILELIKTQPWIMAIIFLAIIYTTTLEIDIFGFKFSLGDSLNEILKPVSSSLGFNFDWKLFVILCFLIAVLMITYFFHASE